MASQSLPPPPLTCSTPPPIDFGPDDDEDPFPDDDQSEELPSFGDDGVPEAIPDDSFYFSASPVRKEVKPSPAALIVDGEGVKVNHIGDEVEVPIEQRLEKEEVSEFANNEQVAKATTTSPSIHDLLNGPKEEVDDTATTITSNNITEFQGEQQLESISTEESLSIPAAGISIGLEEEEEESNDKDVDNPPSLILDVNFNISPSATDINGDINNLSEFSEEIIKEGDNIAFETSPQEENVHEQLPVDDVVVVNEEQQQQTSDGVVTEFQETIIPAEEDEFGDFVENEVGHETKLDHPEDATDAKVGGDNCDFKGEMIEDEIPHPELSDQCVQKEAAANDGEDGDFDDFSDFTSAAGQSINQIESKTSSEWQNSEAAEPQVVEFEADFNQFANFDDFPRVVDDTVINQNVIGLEQTVDEAEDDDDDDFGDFTSSVPVVVTLPELVVEEKLPDIDISNVDGILREMFPENNIIEESQSNRIPRTFKTLVEVNGYETTATNEYHWSKSYSNKCLVKCLGIDTRNILHGTKWNSEMPRFAANLGFSPLQPMKPTSVTSTNPPSGVLKPVVGGGGGAAAAAAMSSTAGGAEVPAVQFDWDSSGLVNPLHALQAHTYLLDLEQLVVVASLENTKTTTSNKSPAAAASQSHSGWSLALERGEFSHDEGVLINGGGGEGVAGDYDKYSPFKTMSQVEESCDSKKSEKQNVLPTQLAATTSTTVKIGVEDNYCAATISEGAIDPEPIKNGLQHIHNIPIEVPIRTDPPETIQPQFTSPLRETHIFTPIKGEIPVSRDNAVGLETGGAATIPIIAESIITVKEYRDVEYDPSRFLGLPGTEGNSEAIVDEFGEFKTGGCVSQDDSKNVVVKEETMKVDIEAGVVNNLDKGVKLGEVGGESGQFSINEDEEDDFADFQSVPVAATEITQSQPQFKGEGGNLSTHASSSLPPISAKPLQVLSVNNLSSMHRESAAQETILMPSILMPKPMMGSSGGQLMGGGGSSVFGGDQEIGKSELDRIEEMFSSQNRASNKGSSPVKLQQPHQPQGQSQEEDEWTDFVSVTEPKITKPATAVNNNSSADDDWTDFVSSTTSTVPTGPNFTPWGAPSPSYQTPLGNRQMTTNLPPRMGGNGGPEMQFVDPTPFFISSAGAGLQSMFGGGGMGQGVMGNGSRKNSSNTGRK